MNHESNKGMKVKTYIEERKIKKFPNKNFLYLGYTEGKLLLRHCYNNILEKEKFTE